MEDGHVFLDKFGDERTSMFCGVYDGHGGREAVDLAVRRLHELFLETLRAKPQSSMREIFEEVFEKTDKEMADQGIDFNGTTAVVAYLRTEPRGRVLYTANCGDARAVLVRHDGPAPVGHRVSFDHKPNLPEEIERIRQASGFVAGNRVNGILSVSRALGDHAMKQYVISKPFTLETVLLPTDTHLVVACDGVWDVLTDQDVAELVHAFPEDCQKAAETLKDRALAKGSMDNISSMVVRL
eukprot:GAFH01002939.1.p2 GENE.GAFH01002939.1~~GAFH01002939.1.p2  ORF type:complete len:277 (+),score=46.88 GAFH01002939.1:114-833(+)